MKAKVSVSINMFVWNVMSKPRFLTGLNAGTASLKEADTAGANAPTIFGLDIRCML